jgi:AraC family transcriptional regulator
MAPATQGTRLSDQVCGPFRVLESVHEPGLMLTRHIHERATITVVLAGDFAEVFPDGLRLCQPATVLVKPAGVPHSNRYGSHGARCLIAEIDGAATTLAEISLSQERGNVLFNAHGGAARLGRRFIRAYNAGDDMGRMALESLLYDVIEPTPALARRGAGPTAIQRAVEFLHDGFRQPMRLSQVAVAAGVQPTYLARAFRRHFNRTPGDLLRELRVDWAAHLLSESRMPLSHVALDSGFTDQSHLTRVFTQRIGMSPARFRRDRATRARTG